MCGGFSLMQWPRALFKTSNQPQEHDVGSKNAASPMSKAQSDRAAAESRIARLEAGRAAELGGDGDVSKIDQIDTAIAAERRAIAILDQRLVALARGERKKARQDREADREAVLKVIEAALAKRTELGAELQNTIKRVVELYEQIKDTKQLRATWPFGLPEFFSFTLDDFGREILRSMRDITGGYDMLPAQVRAVLGYSIGSGGGGFTQVPAAGPSAPNDLAGKLDANAKYVVDVLRKVQIHPVEPEADNDAVAA
jgi:hypothetical protein